MNTWKENPKDSYLKKALDILKYPELFSSFILFYFRVTLILIVFVTVSFPSETRNCTLWVPVCNKVGFHVNIPVLALNFAPRGKFLTL
jgi:hypothetical protein